MLWRRLILCVTALLILMGAASSCEPTFVYPTNGQVLDYEGSYMFKVTPVQGASGYLFGFFQDGQMIYENYADDQTLSPDGEFALHRGNPHRLAFDPNLPTKVMARALVDNQWTNASEITITLVPRKAVVKVLDLRYFPLDANGDLDFSETSYSATLAQIRSRVDTLAAGTEAGLEAGTVYVNDTTAEPYIDYQVVASHELLTPVPPSASFPPFGDHFAMLGDVDICDYVDGQGVRDVWVWMYHTNAIVPIESNMAMGTTSSSLYNQGAYGDISNSYLHNDLPVCQNTYVVYDFNYTRGVDTMLHNYGHQRERLMAWADAALFGEFVDACGNTHIPPNASTDYAYEVPTSVSTDCSDWRPEGGGAVQSVSCADWSCTEQSYHTWWFQRLLGRGNNLPKNGVRLRNWNELLADFDKAALDGRRLTE